MDTSKMHKRVPTEEDCFAILENARWQGRPTCPYCDSGRITALPKERRHKCNSCRTAFSPTTRTVFHRTHLPLQKWFAAISLILDAQKAIPVRHLAKQIGVNKNTAWYLSARIRRAMFESSQRDLLLEIAEINEVRSS